MTIFYFICKKWVMRAILLVVVLLFWAVGYGQTQFKIDRAKYEASVKEEASTDSIYNKLSRSGKVPKQAARNTGASDKRLPLQPVTELDYDHAIRWAIRGVEGPDWKKVEFPMFTTYSFQRIAPPVYERKYPIKVSGFSGTGYAKVKYLGGNPKDLRNWKTLKSYIDL